VRRLEQGKLNITFHNPNTTEELTAILVTIAAEAAKTQIINTIHNEKSDDKTERPSI